MKDITTGKGVIRVQKTNFQGRDYLDVRKMYEDADTKELKFTRKGIAIPLDEATKVAEAITEVIKE